MLKSISYLLVIATLFGCKKKEVALPIEPSLPESKFTLVSNGETLYNFSYSACDISSPSAEEGIGSLGGGTTYVLYSPGIFKSTDLVNSSDDLTFQFIFHDLDVDYSQGTFKDEFWSHLEEHPIEFNKAPFKRDFFLKVKKHGKIYQNWWNGTLMHGSGQSISRDETGLELRNAQFTQFDEFAEICFFSYSVTRLQGEIDGLLITEDGNDTLAVQGLLDVFLHTAD